MVVVDAAGAALPLTEAPPGAAAAGAETQRQRLIHLCYSRLTSSLVIVCVCVCVCVCVYVCEFVCVCVCV